MTLALMITISLTVAAGVLLLLSRDLFRTLVGLACWAARSIWPSSWPAGQAA
jgi:multisubunit Na+/H+ antiporter MnhC subunit